jgi:hypothetical protein
MFFKCPSASYMHKHLYAMHTERHHKYVRRYVKDRVNTTNLEQGLAEDLVVHTLHDLRAQPLQSGFVEPHPASTQMVKTLEQILGIDVQHGVTTCVDARSGAATLHRGDVAIYSFDGASMHAGDIIFFAGTREDGECAFVSAWERVRGGGSAGFWKFTILDDVVRVPICCLRSSAIAHVGTKTATVICPPYLLVD